MSLVKACIVGGSCFHLQRHVRAEEIRSALFCSILQIQDFNYINLQNQNVMDKKYLIYITFTIRYIEIQFQEE